MPSGIVIDICSGFINTIWILIDTDIVNTVLFSSTGYFYYFSLYINPRSQKLQFFFFFFFYSWLCKMPEKR